MSVFSPTFVGNALFYVSQLLVKSWRANVYLHPAFDIDAQYVYGFWHNKLLAPTVLMPKTITTHKLGGLVSTSRDGELLAQWLKRLGYHLIRGSSSRKPTSVLVNLLAATKEGYSIGIAADGPRGPRYEAKAGLPFLANKSGLPLIPMGVAYSMRWQFEKSWDHYQLPFPFSKVVLYCGEPFMIPSMDDVSSVNAYVTTAINACEKKAQLILQGGSQALAEKTIIIPPLLSVK